jgi:hypothetical protein
MQFATRQTFTVPVTSGQYAPEFITFAPGNTNTVPISLIGVTTLVESNVATAKVELWLLQKGADPTASGSYFLFNSDVGNATIALASYPGAQLRVKSGGTAGSMIVNATAD